MLIDIDMLFLTSLQGVLTGHGRQEPGILAPARAGSSS